MASILINDELLDLPAEQNIQTVLNSSLLFGGSGNSIPGSYSLPFQLRLTPKNKRILRNPHLLDSAELSLFNEPCTITVGNDTRSGKLGIQRTTPEAAQVFVIIDVLTSLGTTNLRDLDLGGDRNLDPIIADALVDDMPNADFCLIPMAGLPEELDDPGLPLFSPRINVNAGTYSTNCAVSPHIRLEYLINRIFEHAGVRLINNFQITDELRSIVLSSNKLFFQVEESVSDRPNLVWPETINLSNCMPDMTCAEFIKRLRVAFCLGTGYDAARRTFTLSPAKFTLNSKVHDWTKYVSGEPTTETDISRPRDLAFAKTQNRYDSIDKFETTIPVRGTGPRIPVSSEFTLIEAESIVIRSVKRYNRADPSIVGFVQREELHYQPAQRIGTEIDNDLEIKLTSLVDVRDVLHQGGDYNYEEITFRNRTTAQDVTISGSDAAINLRMAFFRGRGTLQVGNSTFTNVPRGSVGDTLIDGSRIQVQGQPVEYTLHLHGERGIYATWHKVWWDYISRRRIVSFRFTIPPSVFSKYKDLERIKVLNQTYFPSELKLRSTSNDRIVVDGEFISCF